ncbi:MAG TPA: ParB/RepB/Spo0J family partition protein [Candidatus Paceibacterota bacterium]
MSHFYGDAIFWIELDKIRPNPYQPRKEFDEARLRDLAESIRTYGVLQPLVVTRKEVERPDGGLNVEYELISGERRLRASRLAGVLQVPAIIRNDSNDAKIKLELAIIENLQREDLNPVDRAKAFARLAEDFKYKHTEIAEKIGKSREYVSNTLRILMLPEEVLTALSHGQITEGHSRPILMLADRPEEQIVLFRDIVGKKMTVREAEVIARRIAVDRVRKKEFLADPETREIEEKLSETLGTRVQIERKEKGGKIHIDFFSPEDLTQIVSMIEAHRQSLAQSQGVIAPKQTPGEVAQNVASVVTEAVANSIAEPQPATESPRQEGESGEDIYSVKNFTV